MDWKKLAIILGILGVGYYAEKARAEKQQPPSQEQPQQGQPPGTRSQQQSNPPPPSQQPIPSQSTGWPSWCVVSNLAPNSASWMARELWHAMQACGGYKPDCIENYFKEKGFMVYEHSGYPDNLCLQLAYAVHVYHSIQGDVWCHVYEGHPSCAIVQHPKPTTQPLPSQPPSPPPSSIEDEIRENIDNELMPFIEGSYIGNKEACQVVDERISRFCRNAALAWGYDYDTCVRIAKEELAKRNSDYRIICLQIPPPGISPSECLKDSLLKNTIDSLVQTAAMRGYTNVAIENHIGSYAPDMWAACKGTSGAVIKIYYDQAILCLDGQPYASAPTEDDVKPCLPKPQPVPIEYYQYTIQPSQ